VCVRHGRSRCECEFFRKVLSSPSFSHVSRSHPQKIWVTGFSRSQKMWACVVARTQKMWVCVVARPRKCGCVLLHVPRKCGSGMLVCCLHVQYPENVGMRCEV
jgi:hypothetical protein